MKIIYKIIFFLNLNLFNIIFYYNIFPYNLLYLILKKKTFLIQIDVSRNKKVGGPSKFIGGIDDILPYYTRNCHFVSSKKIYPNNKKSKFDFFYLPYPNLNELIYNKWIKIKKINKLILGPIFVPHLWKRFPNKHIWKERNFKEIIKKVKGIGVHSYRVRNYLSQRSNTTDMMKKYIIIRPCSNLSPKKVKPFSKRKIDILFFEKYKDLNRSQQGIQLVKLFKKSYKKIIRIKYGQYTKEIMKKLANNSKFIIYFSFFDTGAIGLKEIQNYGVFTFSHQKDLIIDKDTGFFVPELAKVENMKYAFNIIMKKINIISKLFPNTEKIARKNQKINQCKNSLDDLCKGLF